MAKKTISGQAAFQVPTSRFCIGQSSSGYTLNFSVDGVNWTAWTEGTLANTDQVVSNACPGMFFKLSGNTDTSVLITW